MANTARKPRTPADPNETKSGKFKRLANARLNNIVRNVRSLGKLGTSAYERDPAQLEIIGRVINQEVASALAKLQPRAAAGEKAKRETEQFL